MFGTHGTWIGSKRATSWSRTSVTRGPDTISANEAVRTLPTGNQRENTHGHTSPLDEIANTPVAQCPHSWSTLGSWSRTPRPTCRNRS